VAKKYYQRPLTEDFGWLTTLPLPTKEQAIAYGKQLEQKYEEVEVVPAMTGWAVRYRKPREGKR
jgi:hypothetical protein